MTTADGTHFNSGTLIGWGLGLLGGVAAGNADASGFRLLMEALDTLQAEILTLEATLAHDLAVETFTSVLTVDVRQLAIISTLAQDYHDTLAGNPTAAETQALAAQLVGQLAGLVEQIGDDQNNSLGLLALANQVVGVSSSPFYSNGQDFDPMVSELNYFACLWTTCTALLVEGLHGLAQPDPVTARNAFDEYLQGLSLSATGVPQPLPSDELILDREHGRLFYLHALSARSSKDAGAAAAAMQEGPYTAWRVATQIDLEQLVGSRSVDDLKAAGFDLSAIHPNKDGQYLVGLGGGRSADLRDPGGSTSSWSGDLPFLLVTDPPLGGDPAILIPLGELTAIKVQPAGNAVQALGTYAIKHSGQDKDPSTFMLDNVDITELVSWSSSEPGTLRVQSAPASDEVDLSALVPVSVPLGAGALTWLQPGQAQVTATSFNPFAAGLPKLSGTATLSNANVPPKTLTALYLGPKNVLLTSVGTVTTLDLVGFYSDGTNLGTLTPTFTTSIPEARVVLVDGVYQLDLTATPSVSSFTVTVSVGEITDTSTFYLDIF